MSIISYLSFLFSSYHAEMKRYYFDILFVRLTTILYLVYYYNYKF